MTWYDTHVHLQDEAFAEDWGACLQRAGEAGVSWLNLIAWDLASSETAVDLVAQARSLYPEGPNIVASVGVHPHSAEEWDEAQEGRLCSLLERRGELGIVALGEIGLDYHYENSPREVQKRVFWRQLELAKAYDLPLVIHDREAHGDTLEILERAAAAGLLRPSEAGVLHCYSGSVELSQAFLKLGFYLGFDGPLTFKNAKQPCAVVEAIPLDRLLLETDCPYLTPVPYRGKRNEPVYLPLIGERVAALRGLSPEEVARQTRENALRLFRLPAPLAVG